MARPRPVYDDSDIEADELEDILRNDAQNGSESEEEDDFGKLSFGALKNAQDQLDREDKKDRLKPSVKKEKTKKQQQVKQQPRAVKETRYNDSEDESASDGGFFDEEEDSEAEDYRGGNKRSGSSSEKKRGKHAPTEASSKKPVSKIRSIPGLDNPKHKSLYKDIRFDAALGKADLNKIRKDYKFLDEYRENEIKQIDSILKNPKLKNKMSYKEIEDLEYQSKSLRSRLDSLRNKDMQQEVLKKYKEDNKGTNGGKYYLKKSEQRKIIQKHKFENMKASQREKVVERKRKRRLGKEFKQLEFNRPKN